jgi:RNA polymerase sigma-70 factor (ECF subfamily)
MDDNQVIDVYLRKQASNCFELLYKRYAAKIYAKCYSMLGDAGKAEDATQEIFTKLFLNLSKFGLKSKFSTWVYSVTYNYCIDYIRREKKLKAVFSDEMERAPDLADDTISDKEMMEMDFGQLKRVLLELSPDDTSILLMKYQDGMQIKEIAEVLDKTESAVKMQIKRAKERAQRLRGQLFPSEERH